MKLPPEKEHTWTTQEWAALSSHEQYWYTLFWRASYHHNWVALKELCDMCGADYIRIRAELNYESHAHVRQVTRMNQKKGNTYDAIDYGWVARIQKSLKNWIVYSNQIDPKTRRSPNMEIPYKALTPVPVAPPVRKVSVEEYLATRKTPGYKGVTLDVELKYLKEQSKRADKQTANDRGNDF